jgi:alpha-mannosidase
MMSCERATFHFAVDNVPAMGYATYRLERLRVPDHSSLVRGHNTMENEHIRVRINPDGTLCVTHKETGALFDGLHYFEDGGEAGHAWMHIEPDQDRIVTSRGCPVTIALEEEGPLVARYRVKYRMRIPSGLDENRGDPWKRLDGAGSGCRRTDESREMVITSLIMLKQGARCVEVTTRFDNGCKNHRLRVLFPTRLKANTCHVESAFDVVERPIEYGPDSPWQERSIDPTFPMQRFVDVSDGRAGLAVINDGLREYEVMRDTDRAIALTLLRAFEVSLTTVSKRWEIHPEMELAQSPGGHEFRYAIFAHAGDWSEAGVSTEAERLVAPVEPAQAGRHRGDLPKRNSFLSIGPAERSDGPSQLVMSALKQSEDGAALIFRLFNPTGKRVNAVVRCGKRIESAQVVNLEETPVRDLPVTGRSVKLRVDRKKIVTLKLALARAT